MSPSIASEHGHWRLPGIANLHSHAFQRAMAGLAERTTHPSDSFWTWRETMYRMAARFDPETCRTLRALRSTTLITPTDAPLSLLVPSFLLSEIQRAFEIGFMIFLPFLIIDLVVAAILMSMGMMMVPPAVVSLPFKLIFFVLADGWALISGALVRSYF